MYLLSDLETGQLYSIVIKGEPHECAFIDLDIDDKVLFYDRLHEAAVTFDAPVFARLVHDGAAHRIDTRQISPRAIALANMGSDDPRRPGEEQIFMEAQTLLFLAKIVDLVGCKKSKKKLDALIRDHMPGAIEREYLWRGKGTIVSDSALRKALQKCGVSGERYLSDFFDKRGKKQERSFDPSVLKLLKEASRYFWAASENNYKAAIDNLVADGYDLGGWRVLGEVGEFRIPSDSAIKRYINSKRTFENYAKKHGITAAKRIFVANRVTDLPVRPLHIVECDHTQLDTELTICDEEGRALTQLRPYIAYAVDRFSHVCLAVIVTFDPPSLATIGELLRRAMKPNDELVELYGHYKSATDGWGKIDIAVLDNGLVSVQECWACAGLSEGRQSDSLYFATNTEISNGLDTLHPASP